MRIRINSLLAVLVMCGCATTVAAAKPRAEFHRSVAAPAERVYQSASQAIRESGWKITTADDKNYWIEFKSGWSGNLKGSVKLKSIEQNLSYVRIAFSPNRGMWGISDEAYIPFVEKQAARFFERLRAAAGGAVIADTSYREPAQEYAGGTLVETARPAQVILSATPERVRARIVADFVAGGFILAADTPHQISFYRDGAAERGALAYLLFGESLARAYRSSANFVVMPSGNDTAVVVTSELYTQDGYGRTSVTNISLDRTVRAQFQNYLDKLKADLERDISKP